MDKTNSCGRRHWFASLNRDLAWVDCSDLYVTMVMEWTALFEITRRRSGNCLQRPTRNKNDGREAREILHDDVIQYASLVILGDFNIHINDKDDSGAQLVIYWLFNSSGSSSTRWKLYPQTGQHPGPHVHARRKRAHGSWMPNWSVCLRSLSC